MRRRLIILGLTGAGLGAWFGGCDSERQPFPSSPAVDAAIAEASSETSSSRCTASLGPDTWSPPTNIPERAVAIDGITCRHPAVHSDCALGWCRIPAGCFIMGSPSTEWGRGAYSENEIGVTLTHDLLVHQTETTRAEWASLGYPLETVALKDGGGECDTPECPLASVSWWEAIGFANALSTREGLAQCYTLTNCTGAMGAGMRCDGVEQPVASLYDCPGYRLPMEVEWEYAARAGSRTAFYSGDISPRGNLFAECCEESALNPIAWYCFNSAGWTQPVRQKAPNAWGLHDMAGNAEEWVNDPYTGDTEQGPLVDPYGVLTKKNRANARGGAARDPSRHLRSASGASDYSRDRRGVGLGTGFRLVRTLSPTFPVDAGPD